MAFLTGFLRANWLLPALLLTWACPTLTAAEAPVSFSRDVRPILSNRCFKCHGFDPGTREAGLRLDTRDALFSEHNGARPFVPGNPELSAALQRILSTDDDLRMPPPSARKDLTDAEKQTLKAWVEQGAPWEPHWAFQAPVRPAVPEQSPGSRNEIDAFITQKLKTAGLDRSPEADRLTLIRRVSLDLTGIPPTPEEADAFVNDPAPDAYEKLVDRLLASEAYGERWARRWLDLARYADTNGYEKDRNRTIWPWRDWVVRALNSNMPFDQFTIRQIAGDMLPDATQDDHIATGFHRNTMLNEEGGIDPLEFRYHAMTDRVATTGATWLGLTTGCAQCHDHKYDPISHVDYFGLMALLNNADEVDLPLRDPKAPPPSKDRPLKKEVRDKIHQLATHWPAMPGTDQVSPNPLEASEAAFRSWLTTQQSRQVTWTTLEPVKLSSNLPLLTRLPDNTIFVTGDTTKQDRYEITAQPRLKGVRALRLEALPDERLPGGGPGLTYYEGASGEFFLTEIRLQSNGQPVPLVTTSQNWSKNRFGNAPVTAAMAIDGDLQSGWGIDGRQGQRLVAVFNFREPADLDDLTIEMLFGRHHSASLGKFRLSVTTDDQAEAIDIDEDAEALLLKPHESLTVDDVNRLRVAFLMQAPELKKQSDEIRQLMKEPAPLTTPVFQERPPENPRTTYRHHRGEYQQPAELVAPATPAFLPPLPDGTRPDRLAFARWLVSRNNPLTARVVVNQQWAALFGRGIVPTVQDFGFQGTPPTHPELLDWLAVEFMDSGWNLKRLHRLIVTSATYRQSSIITPQRAELDPGNRLLSRAPRLRLEAEIIRDSTLAASGLLVLKTGGPPVRPPQPEGVTEAAYGAPKWTADTGPDRYRRSLYTFQKRTAPFAMFATFDAPSGEACQAQRDVSNTPLQGLTLLNDVMFDEIAKASGQRTAALTGDDVAKIHTLFRQILTRPPTTDEQADLQRFVTNQRHRLKDHPEEAAALLGPAGEKLTADQIHDQVHEKAVWSMLARALFSLDEAITRN